MKRVLPASVLAVLALASSHAAAQMMYEPFDYGSGAVGQPFSNLTGTFQGYANPSTGQPWFEGGNGTANENTIATGSMTTPAGLAPAMGNSAITIAQDSPGSLTAFNSINVTTVGTTVYDSVLFTINDMSNTSATGTGGGFVFGLTPTVGHFTGTNLMTIGASLQVRHDQDHGDTSKFEVGLRVGASQTVWFTTQGFATGTPVFLVFAHQLNGSVATDVESMWVNPAASTFGAGTAPAPSIQISGNGVGAVGLGSVYVNRGGNNASVPKAMQFDEIRVDTSWGQVTAPAGSVFTGATSVNWSNAGTWNAGGVPNAPAAFAYLSGSAGGAVNLDAPQTVGTLTFKGPGSYVVSTANASTLTLNGGTGGTSAVNVEAVMDPVTANTPIASSHSISTPITLNNNIVFNVAASQTLTMSGNVTNPGNAATFTKNGPGTLVFTGTSTHGGLNTVNAGTLAIGSDASLGVVPAAPAVNLVLIKGSATSATLRFEGDTTLNANRTISLFQTGGGGPTINTNGHNDTIAGQITTTVAGGVNLNKAGSGTLTLTGDNSTNLTGGYLNAINVTGGTLQAMQDISLGKAGTGINLNAGTFQFGAAFTPTGRPFAINGTGGAVDTNGLNATIDGVVSGTGPFTKRGAGTLTLTGGNPLSGATVVNGGTLLLTQNAFGPVTSGAGGADLKSGQLVFDYTGTTAPAVRAALKTSHDSSNFTDPAQRYRTSNAADANHGIAYSDDGVSKLTLMYTWYGDVNLDGTVNADDYALFDRSVAKGGGATWVAGDFNYDGVVNAADYLAIDTSYGKITGVLAPSFLSERESEFGEAYVAALTAAVPEPTTLSAAGIAAGLLAGRRRNRGKK